MTNLCYTVGAFGKQDVTPLPNNATRIINSNLPALLGLCVRAQVSPQKERVFHLQMR